MPIQLDIKQGRLSIRTVIVTGVGAFGALSADLKGSQSRKLLRIRPNIIDVGPNSAPKPGETQPKIGGAARANRHKPIPIDFVLFVCVVFVRFLAKVGPKTPSKWSGSKCGAERTEN